MTSLIKIGQSKPNINISKSSQESHRAKPVTILGINFTSIINLVKQEVQPVLTTLSPESSNDFRY